MTTRKDENLTRRRIFQAGLAAVGGVVAIGSVQAVTASDAKAEPLAGRKLAQQKIAQNLVQYQKMPKNGAQCSTCVNYEAPSSCKIVAGTIVPDGWCIAYAPKQA